MPVKLEWLGYRMVEKLWRHVKPFSYNTSVSRTDGRTDGWMDRITTYIYVYQYRASAAVCWRAIKISKFPNKGRNVNGLHYLLKKLRDTGTTARQPGSGWRQSACSVQNGDTASDLVMSHKGALKCIKPHVKLQGRPAFTTRRILHYSLGSSIIKMFRCLF